MRRRLIVMRHAKSDWESGVELDHERPLNERGRRDAPRVAARIVELGWTPQLILSSDSVRTRETFDLMRSTMPAARASFLPSLYHGGMQSLRDALVGQSDDETVVLALGHNPGWTHAVSWLSGESAEMKTGSAALLERGTPNWRVALDAPGGWRLVDVIHPKEFD